MPCPATGSYIIPMGSKIIDHKGYSTYESVNRGTLESYITNTNDSYELDNILIDSIYDVSDFLTQLGKYDFTHNNLSVSEVLVDEELDGILTYKVKDFDNSYIEFNDLEIGVDLPIFDIHTEEPGIECVDSDYYTILTSKCCRILGSSLRSKRKHGIHIDIYTLILSIALHPNVSKNIMNLPKFNRFMNYIFIEDDLVKINEMMRSGKINTFTMTELTCFLIGGVALLFEPDIKIKRFMSGYA